MKPIVTAFNEMYSMPYELNPFFLIFLSYGIGTASTELVKFLGLYRYFEGQNYISDQLTQNLGVLYFGWLIRHSFMGGFNQKLKYQGKGQRAKLEQLKNDMTYAEVNHLIAFVLLLVASLFFPLWGASWWYVLALVPINIVFNLYLVFLQQYNKRRIDRILPRN